jgi:CheY-like chemotaxis protein
MPSQKTLLIIEDDKSLQGALVQAFKNQKITVITADNGKEGLDLAINRQPDMILLDVIMPVMDGASMLEKLRNEPKGKKLRVIGLTNSMSDSVITVMTGLGIEDYFIKSNTDLDALVGVVFKKLAQPAHNLW